MKTRSIINQLRAWRVGIAVLAVLAPAVWVSTAAAEDDPFAERQVFIEVLIVETDYDANESQGVVHQYMQRVNGELRGTSYLDDPEGDKGSVRPSGVNFPGLDNRNEGLQLVGTTDLETGVLRSTLQALVQSGKAQIMSKPSILVLNGKQGKIEAGETLPYLNRTDPRNDTFVTSFKNLGLTLKVTPTIYNERKPKHGKGNPKASDEEVARWGRYILLEVEANDSDVTRYRMEASTPMPIIDTRKQTTTVVVESGKTFIMGGLLRQREIDSKTGLPVLADIPGVGKAFSSKNKIKVTKELTITITPTIVMDEMAVSEQIDKVLDLTDELDAEAARSKRRSGEGRSIDEKLRDKRKGK